ncbi:hypothetical protein O181_122954 [Austropuccinia psidii MF-1]|uniref:Uncharacterized protein n=1 Tax=Austropuccinia psidii MF-1 TaxID=1389203 RepID=A0A9Q3KP32_9BASI|nr:hypothetical protein [Austropuccinia psidii MF-1]
MVHGPRSVAHLGPFWPNPMREKGAKGGSSLALKPQLGPPEPILAPNSIKPQNGHKTLRTQFWPITTMDHFSSHALWNPPEATRSAQFNRSPHLKGNSSTPPRTPYSRLQEWCIYGIIYHYAPFLLSNFMVTFSGPNSIFPNQGPKIQHPFQRRIS